ncbi:hypothetical protein GCK32_015810 [Trichostrongylus colubriformis]|uniref:Uncharacterized protein n=1 Tax=Trichostrongylus colubriformis TaxID=6319 RepID=A0AAN8FHY7_TRICO
MGRNSRCQAKLHDGSDGTLLSRQRQHYLYESEHNTEQPLYCQSSSGGSQTTKESGGTATRHNGAKTAKKNNKKKKRKGRRRSRQRRKCDIRLTERNSLLDENAAPNVSIFELGSKLERLHRHVHAIRQIVDSLSSKNKKTYALRPHIRYVTSFHQDLKKVIESSRRNVEGIPKAQEREPHGCPYDISLDNNGIQHNSCQEVEQQNQPHFHYFTLSDLEHSAGTGPGYPNSRSFSLQTMRTGKSFFILDFRSYFCKRGA